MSVIFSQCLDCKHFDFDNLNKNTCKAFPYGIPEDIFWNKIIHTQNIENDNGIKFAPISEWFNRKIIIITESKKLKVTKINLTCNRA